MTNFMVKFVVYTHYLSLPVGLLVGKLKEDLSKLLYFCYYPFK